MCTWICTCTVFNANNFCWRRRLLLLSPLSANAQLWWSDGGKWCGSSALQRFFRHAGVGIQLLLLLQLFAHFMIFLSELWKFVFFSQQNCFHYSSKLLSAITRILLFDHMVLVVELLEHLSLSDADFLQSILFEMKLINTMLKWEFEIADADWV